MHSQLDSCGLTNQIQDPIALSPASSTYVLINVHHNTSKQYIFGKLEGHKLDPELEKPIKFDKEIHEIPQIPLETRYRSIMLLPASDQSITKVYYKEHFKDFSYVCLLCNVYAKFGCKISYTLRLLKLFLQKGKIF